MKEPLKCINHPLNRQYHALRINTEELFFVSRQTHDAYIRTEGHGKVFRYMDAWLSTAVCLKSQIKLHISDYKLVESR